MTDSQLLKRVVEHISTSVIVTDLFGKVIYANKAAHRTLEFAEGMLIWSNFGEVTRFSGASGIENFAALSKRLITSGASVEYECGIETRSGKVLLCRVSSFVDNDTSNTPANIVSVFRDVSAERAVDEELEQKTVEMARMNSELIRTNQELKRVSEIKTKFLSIASHELKTPLTSIKGYSEIIIDNMKDRVDPGVFKMIESISRAADRLHDVIINMLDVSRIEQKKLRLKPEMIRLETVASECMHDLEQFSLQRNISFQCCFEDGLPEFYGDRVRMIQVFTNLFSNALKYSPDGSSISIDIRLEDSETFHLVVSDKGIGVDKGEQEKIFDPFYEVASPTSHSTGSSKFMGGGTGLGLSIVKGVIERHGGDIWVESQGTMTGRYPGSQFHILLPVKPVIRWDDDENHGQAKPRTRELLAVGRGDQTKVPGRPRVLVVDDDEESINLCRVVLSPFFEIETAVSGESGLIAAFSKKPALVLLDKNLPGLDGCIVCRILKSQDETKDIPISFFSAATQQSEIEKCFSSGADDFIVKPFNARELADKVHRLLSVRHDR